MPSSTDPIELNEVGAFGELCLRPNPNGFAILQVPPFEAMIPFLAKQLGHDPSPDEIEIARQKAPSIVVAKDVAEKMARARASRT